MQETAKMLTARQRASTQNRPFAPLDRPPTLVTAWPRPPAVLSGAMLGRSIARGRDQPNAVAACPTANRARASARRRQRCQ
jgi:hypothetical protein